MNEYKDLLFLHHFFSHLRFFSKYFRPNGKAFTMVVVDAGPDAPKFVDPESETEKSDSETEKFVRDSSGRTSIDASGKSSIDEIDLDVSLRN